MERTSERHFNPARRELFQLALGAFCVGAHGLGASVRQSAVTTSAAHLSHLDLHTSAPLPAMKEFYAGRLGLEVVGDAASSLTVRAGASTLTFQAGAAGTAPFYHFAFNIPQNKIVEACEWQRTRSPLIPIPARLRADGFPPEVVNYSHWNAHSVFFLDPGGNVVEYIARHDLDNASRRPFGPRDILCASEIAFVVDDVIATAAAIAIATGLSRYRNGGDANFTALGADDGLVLVMKRGRILNFAETREKAASVYPTAVRARTIRAARVEMAGFPYVLASE